LSELNSKVARRATYAVLSSLFMAVFTAATFVASGLTFFPGPTRMFMAIMSSVGLAEFVDAATEALEWTGQAARVQAGLERSDHRREAHQPPRPVRSSMTRQ
jgi:hypothetical protein